ncbi:hypothetical protein FJ970_10620 [Mesorhizobium sp. B2-1-8]|uniref:hypothetical protein n=1 Tax=Mesorhizobium sp. B2-1-8 TaxID=2589967 RepID=UPI00112828D4|nr:hypothetical protein [Mesorhizobium sp. B2-1-8]UCI21373.1 hypothetical protein FJ970_10620 [Mesorhizobium sp. B2-1-8]
MLEGLTSRFVAKCFAVAGVGLLVVCLALAGWQRLHGTSDPTEAECEANLLPAVAPQGEALMRAGKLQVLGVWPHKTSINRSICLAIAGVVSESSDIGLADDVNRAQKARDDAQASYETAALSSRDAAWDKLQKANTTLSTALAAAAGLPQPVPLSVFLNGNVVPNLTVKAYAKWARQIVLIPLMVPPSAEESGAGFWRDLLGARPTDGNNTSAGADKPKVGEKAVSVGLSRSSATMPEPMGRTALTVVIYDMVTLWAGILAFLCFAISFCGLARHTTMLRDNSQTGKASLLASDAVAAALAADSEATAKAKVAAAAAEKAKSDADAAQAAAAAADAATKTAATDNAAKAAVALTVAAGAVTATTAAANDAAAALTAAQTTALATAKTGDVDQPLGPYSLARTQMAFWMILTIAGFIFIWLSMGIYIGLITSGILVLLGINATSGLAAISLNDESDKTSVSKSFCQDILNDGDGPALHRIQAVAWTAILGIIFIWNVFWNFAFINFDTNLLLLIGVAQGMYLGFKWKEAPAK